MNTLMKLKNADVSKCLGQTITLFQNGNQVCLTFLSIYRKKRQKINLLWFISQKTGKGDCILTFPDLAVGGSQSPVMTLATKLKYVLMVQQLSFWLVAGLVTEVQWTVGILLNCIISLPVHYWSWSPRCFTHWMKTQVNPYIIICILVIFTSLYLKTTADFQWKFHHLFKIWFSLDKWRYLDKITHLKGDFIDGKCQHFQHF